MIFNPDTGGEGQPPDRQQYAYQFFLNRGFSPTQAAGILGGLRGETSNLNTSQQHDGGIGLGIAGWNGPRLRGLFSYAQQAGGDPRSLDTQLSYVDHELRTSERGALGKLTAAQTPQQAGNAMLSYFRPANWNVPGAHPERANYAASLFNSYSGDKAPSQQTPAQMPGAAAMQQATAMPQASPQAASAQSTDGSPFNFAAPQDNQQQPATPDFSGLLGRQGAPQSPSMSRRPLNVSWLAQLLQNAPPELRGLLRG